MNEKDGGPAFPPNAGWRDNDPNANGMTLRDYFAAKALDGLLACEIGVACESTTPEGVEQERREYAQDMAKSAYRFADAMLAERAK